MGEDTSDTNDEDEVEDDDVGTTSEAYRWKYLSTYVTIVTTTGYLGLAYLDALGYVSNVSGGMWTTLTAAFLTCVAYSVGTDTLRAVQKARGGK